MKGHKGRLILLAQAERLSLLDSADVLAVHLVYHEEPAKLSSEAGRTGYKRTIEMGRIAQQRIAPVLESKPDASVLLTTITMENGKIKKLDGTDRQKAGATVREKLGVNMLTLTKADVVQENEPQFTCSAANEASLNGSFSINGGLRIGEKKIPVIETLNELQAQIDALKKRVQDLEKTPVSRKVKGSAKA